MVHKLKPSDTLFSSSLSFIIVLKGSSDSIPSSKDITSAKYFVIQSLTTRMPFGLQIG